MILTIRTDKPEAEVGLFADSKQLGYRTWLADRQLSTTLLSTIHDELRVHQASFDALTGVVVFKGPGSFTGLRIGITVANALAYGLHIPIVGAAGDAWVQGGIAQLHKETDERIVTPLYGAEPHITPSRK